MGGVPPPSPGVRLHGAQANPLRPGCRLEGAPPSHKSNSLGSRVPVQLARSCAACSGCRRGRAPSAAAWAKPLPADVRCRVTAFPEATPEVSDTRKAPEGKQKILGFSGRLAVAFGNLFDFGNFGGQAQTGCLKAVWPDFFGATKWPYNWSAGLIFGATGIAGRAPSF
jgi:hypothetical protein